MIIYSSTKKGFQDDFLVGSLIDHLDDILAKRYRRAGSSELQSWRNSLSYMDRVIADNEIPETAGIAIEYVIPSSEKRIDFLISGYDQKGRAQTVIIELKQWQHVEEVPDQSDMVRTLLGGALRVVPHPSYQAWSYASLIRDFNSSAQEMGIGLNPCAYLHNYRLEQQDDPLVSARYREIIGEAPVFTSTETLELRKFIKQFVKKGDSNQVLYDIDNGRVRPGKSLQDALSSMLQGNEEFVMIDDQKVVYEEALLQANRSYRDGNKRVYIVEGGPGTGKSVVAINLLVELTKREMVTQYVTKNSAPREVYKTKLKGTMRANSIDNMFKGSGVYVDSSRNMLDAIVVDESHRLNEKSGLFSNQGENQIKEIIQAAKFSVFFIDEDQRVTTKDIGTVAEIEAHALAAGAEVFYGELESQFRCNGSGGYLAWLDDVLQIRPTANAIFDLDYDIQVVDSPHEMMSWLEEKNKERNRARLLAGYCWEWPKETRGDEGFKDITIPEYDFGTSWNLDSGIWALNEESLYQAGCIHTSQGLEFDYVGVIIGQDMRFENGKVVTDFKKRAKSDQSTKGLVKLSMENPEEANRIADNIIKNTYRTLMSRGMKGCRVFCTDLELSDYLKRRLSNSIIKYGESESEYLLVAEDNVGAINSSIESDI